MHYKVNLTSGIKEAKILEDENEKTSLTAVEQEDDETVEKSVNNDVDMEAARRRIEDALKNIPFDSYEGVTEEKFKEITKKHRSYKELKEELKELDLNMQTEAEIMKELVERFKKLTGDDEESNAEKLTILEDLEYLSHSIDNSLLFISLKGLEDIIIPNFNQTNVKLLVKTLTTLGVILQNNQQAKTYVIEKTNIGNYLITILSKSISTNQLSAVLFAYGSLIRNNRQVSSELSKKGVTVLLAIISDKPEVSLPMKTKALVLLSDLSKSDELKDQDFDKLCKSLDNYFNLNRNGFRHDIDSADKMISAFGDLQEHCLHTWSQSPLFRHTLLVLLNHSKAMLESEDEDLRFIYSENARRLADINKFLYDELNIAEDDLTKQYDQRDEL